MTSGSNLPPVQATKMQMNRINGINFYNMQGSKILITNYPRIYQRPSFVMVGDESRTLDIVCGYDIKLDNHQVTLNIARDLITALLTFDNIYIEGNHIWDILQVWGSEYVKELLRLHILCIIPDQELNPVMKREGKGEWDHGFFSYAQGYVIVGHENEKPQQQIHTWSHIENTFHHHGFQGIEANTILYLIDESSVDIGDVKEIQDKINQETKRDSQSLPFLTDPNFYRCNIDGKWEYNQVSRVRLQELNKSAILAAQLGIDNVKMDAEIGNLMMKKTASAFTRPLHTGTDVLIHLEQQKGFPDLGQLFVEKIINLDDILKIRDNFNGKIFRYWAKMTDYEEGVMRQEIMNSVNNILGTKCLQPIRMLACNLIGIGGFLPGMAASAFDSYVLDKVLKGWHPNFFLDNELKRMIDKSVEENNKVKKDAFREQMFKGVGRNDLCPCGSGKKYKKCHGKN